MFLLVILLILLPPLAIDEYAPSMPAMVQALHTSMSTIQLSIAAYLLAQSISQLINGPISDRFGRKKPLIANMLIYIVGSILALFATGPAMLLVGRFIQGAGMGCAAITAPSLISDTYSGQAFKKASSYVLIIYSFVPIVAPVIGGYLQQWFGWRANFLLLLLFPLIVFILIILFLPETHTPTEEHRLHLPQLLKNYASVLSSPIYVGFVIAMAFLWSIIMVFSVVAPFILQKELGLSASQYGHLALLVGGSFLLGNILSRVLTDYINDIRLILVALTTQLLFSTLMLISALFYNMNVWLLLVPTILIIFSNGIAFPKLYSHALSIFKNLVGIASSLVGAVMLFGSVAVTAIIAHLSVRSILQTAFIYFSLALLCVITFNVARFIEMKNKKQIKTAKLK